MVGNCAPPMLTDQRFAFPRLAEFAGFIFVVFVPVALGTCALPAE
jgi:hypothetical protein